jgi:hypothetical protein
MFNGNWIAVGYFKVNCHYCIGREFGLEEPNDDVLLGLGDV